MARWHALAEGLRSGGVEGFLAAYGRPGVAEQYQETVLKVIRQRLSQLLADENAFLCVEEILCGPRSTQSSVCQHFDYAKVQDSKQRELAIEIAVCPG